MKNCLTIVTAPPALFGCRVPRIITQPNSQQAVVNGSVTLTVVASGSATLIYEWRRNGIVIAGATSASYTNSNIQFGDSGEYTVKVSNPCGFIVSANALLIVNSSGGGNKTIFVKDTDFDAGTNTYINTDMAGKTIVVVFAIGFDFLKYNFANPSDTINEYAIRPGGGIDITIPGFDVHSSNNYFLITY